jgi:hypothetical protein
VAISSASAPQSPEDEPHTPPHAAQTASGGTAHQSAGKARRCAPVAQQAADRLFGPVQQRLHDLLGHVSRHGDLVDREVRVGISCLARGLDTTEAKPHTRPFAAVPRRAGTVMAQSPDIARVPRQAQRGRTARVSACSRSFSTVPSATPTALAIRYGVRTSLAYSSYACPLAMTKAAAGSPAIMAARFSKHVPNRRPQAAVICPVGLGALTRHIWPCGARRPRRGF